MVIHLTLGSPPGWQGEDMPASVANLTQENYVAEKDSFGSTAMSRH